MSLSDRSLEFLCSAVQSHFVTLETGIGFTTLLFVVLAGKHYAIAPAKDRLVFDRITEYLRDKQISVPSETLEFIAEGSEFALPRRTFPELDLVLIDGNHGFPIPFVDWFYTRKLLRIGGLLVVDDCQLWTGRVLKDFLLQEPEWKLVFSDAAKTFAFRKTAAILSTKDWYQQSAVVNWSK